MYTKIDRVEWDSGKAQKNLIKHGISFFIASLAFDDEKHSQHEQRHWLIGKAENGPLLVIVFTMRQNDEIIRIISARIANNKEIRLYEENKRV